MKHYLCGLLLSSLLSTLAAQTAAIRPDHLRLEYRVNPLGIDAARPRLSWQLAAVDPKARDLKQTACRILVASRPDFLKGDYGDLWDSGRLSTDQSIQIEYAGAPLTSGLRAFWKVQVWDQQGRASAWSPVATWSMGLLAPQDWQGKWIGRDEEGLQKNPASPYWNLAKAHWIWATGTGQQRNFQATLTIPAGRRIKHALCVMGADNQFELTLNGREIGRGTGPQMPGEFDITPDLHPGDNAIAVKATGARGRQAGLIGAFRMEFATGDPLMFYTGFNWPGAQDLGAYGMAPWGEVGFSQERWLPARMLRKQFETKSGVQRATVYLSGLGLSELYLNGAKIGDAVLSPGLTDYDKRVLYVTYDVTRKIAAGPNAIGLILGNGRYWAPRSVNPINTRSFGSPKARLQLEVEYADGTVTRVVTDESWKLSTDGPVRGNNEYDGEDYDARKEIRGWDRAGFDDSAWEPAHVVAAPAGEAVAQMAEPLRVTETLRPVKVTEPRPGVHIFDMGQNMVGWSRLHVAGPQGTRISLRFAETLRDDGTLYVDNLRSARANDFYTLKGGASETWEPRFTYHGFRYVEVTGYPGKPALGALEGRVVHDAMTRIADFSSSDPLLNKIHHNIFWGVRGNYRSIPTDCPQRDERQGWLGDRSMVSRSESYLFDVAAFYTKWTNDLMDAQRPTGSIPDVVPNYWVLYNDDVTWPSTYLFVPGMLYEQYGDLRVLERAYPGMKKWIEYMRGFLQNGLMPKDQYADWCVPPESPKLIHSQDPARRTEGKFIGTTYYYHLLRLMARYAKLVGKPQDATEFEALAVTVHDAFQKAYFKPADGIYSNGTQTSSILPLAFNMPEEQERRRVFENLTRKIEQESKGHIGVGLVGAQFLMRTLSDNGRADVAYEIATQKTYPGWGYMIEQGATTIRELWNGDTADPAMNSGNHVMQVGDLGVWLYEYLAGIRSDPASPGFKHILIRPYPVGALTFVKASHESMYGRISSSWRREQSRFTLDVTIPPNNTATITMPDGKVQDVGSGIYTFTCPIGR
jgi:alpha-L-rhamnosidase